MNYELNSQNLAELPGFQFQYKIPVNYAQYITEIPVFYIYKGIKIGYINIDMNDVLENSSQAYVNEYQQTNYLNYQQIKTVYYVSNVPALKEEDYVNNINNFYGKIDHELQTIQFPNQEPKQIATTWESLAKSIYEEKDFGED